MEVSRITLGTVLSLTSYLALFIFVSQADFKLPLLSRMTSNFWFSISISWDYKPVSPFQFLQCQGSSLGLCVCRASTYYLSSIPAPTSVFSTPRRVTGRVGPSHFMFSECVHYGYGCSWREIVIEHLKAFLGANTTNHGPLFLPPGCHSITKSKLKRLDLNAETLIPTTHEKSWGYWQGYRC